MISNKKIIVFAVIIFLSLPVLFISGCAGSNTTNNANTPSSSNANSAASAKPGQNNNLNSNTAPVSGTRGTDSDHDGLPDSVEKTLGTSPLNADTDGDGQPDKIDKDPLYTPNLIQENSTLAAPIKVTDARVEDNVNAADHLEITLTNTGKTELKDFDVYYTVTDTVTSAQEGYYLKLAGFKLSPGVTQTLHFDNKKGINHFGGNTNGLYGTSKNALEFKVQLHPQGYAPLQIPVKKAKGTAEVAD